MKIGIIGAGQLGSRHLQAIKKVKFPLEIFVFDPSNNSLDIAKKRYEEIATEINHKINFECTTEIKDHHFDMVINASSSKPRRVIVESLLANNKVDCLVLEKTLFTMKDDYSNILKLASEKSVQTYVNTPRRMMPVYGHLKELIGSDRIDYSISGGMWGLASNAIHFADTMSFLTGETDFSVDTSRLDTKILSSKRAGYLELTGGLILNFQSGHRLSLRSDRDNSRPILSYIDGANSRFVIKENESKYYFSSSSTEWKWDEKQFQFLFQSDMTNILVEKHAAGVPLPITEINDSTKMHLQIFNPINLFLKEHYQGELDQDFPFS